MFIPTVNLAAVIFWKQISVLDKQVVNLPQQLSHMNIPQKCEEKQHA